MRKLTISTRYLITFFVILAFYNVVFSQNETYSVPAKWELYSVTDKKVSFLMPRLPILLEGGDQCRGENYKDYATYTDGVVYTVRIASKVATPNSCHETVRKTFDEKNFLERVNQLKLKLTDESNSANNISNDSTIKLNGTDKIIKLINDFENRRWFEFAIYGADEKKSDVRNFLASLKIENQTTGIEIGQGAERVFGDAPSIIEDKITNGSGNVETIKRMLVKTDSKESKGITVILKSRANYTDAARQTNIQGKVSLRVTFQANGAIGAIYVDPSVSAFNQGLGSNAVTGGDYGLTDEAIKAARKIVFIPAQRDGARYSVTKPVEYIFSIY